MSQLEVDLARAKHAERLVEVQNERRARQAAAVRRSQRRAERLSHKAQRVSRRAEQAAERARLALVARRSCTSASTLHTASTLDRYQALSPGEHIVFPGLSCVRTPIVERWSPVPSAGRRWSPRLRRSPGRRRWRTASSVGSATTARATTCARWRASSTPSGGSPAREPSSQSSKPGSESRSTWRNGTRASSWLSTPTPPAKVRWMSMYAAGRFSLSMAAYASPRGSLTLRNCSCIQALENWNSSTPAGSMNGAR